MPQYGESITLYYIVLYWISQCHKIVLDSLGVGLYLMLSFFGYLSRLLSENSRLKSKVYLMESCFFFG